MTVQLYIDYLDYSISKNYSFSDQLRRLRYDLLCFNAPDEVFVLSVPACVKLKGATEVLMKLDDFWIHRRFFLQLDQKHGLNPDNYFNKRINKLAANTKESDFINNFEIKAYLSQRPKDFYHTYLGEYIGINNKDLFIDKKQDTDALFRQKVKDEIDNNSDNISRLLPVADNIKLHGAFNEIDIIASDPGHIFQREYLVSHISDKFSLPQNDLLIIKYFLTNPFQAQMRILPLRFLSRAYEIN